MKTLTKGNRNWIFCSIRVRLSSFFGSYLLHFVGEVIIFLRVFDLEDPSCESGGGAVCVSGPPSFDNRVRKVYMSQTATAIQIFA